MHLDPAEFRLSMTGFSRNHGDGGGPSATGDTIIGGSFRRRWLQTGALHQLAGPFGFHQGFDTRVYGAELPLGADDGPQSLFTALRQRIEKRRAARGR